jgi:serine/threonine protein kinase
VEYQESIRKGDQVFVTCPGRFTKHGVLGSGSAGVVFLVSDSKQNNEKVALKVLTDPNAFDENTVERFQDEMRIARELNHSNIVRGFDIIETRGIFAYTMEYVNGVELSELIEQRQLTPKEIDSLFIQLLSALSALHAKSILHRDIKLENILVTKDLTVKLSDLGLMKQLQSKRTKTGVLLGTPQYFAPEYIKSGEYTKACEIYSVGVLLWEVLARERFLNDLVGFEAVQWLIRNRFKLPEPKAGPLPKKYQRIVKRATSYSSRERFASAEKMSETFNTEDGLLPEEGRVEVVISHAPTNSGLGGWAVVLVALVLLAAGIYLGVSGFSDRIGAVLGVFKSTEQEPKERLPSF